MQISFWYYVRRFWRHYVFGLCCLLLTNVLAATIPLRIKGVIDELDAPEPHWQALGVIMGIVLVMFGIRILSRYFLLGVGRRAEHDARNLLYAQLLALPRSYYDVNQTGDLMSRLTNDLTSLKHYMGAGMMFLFNAVFAYATVLPVMAVLSWRLTLFSFILYPVVAGLMRWVAMRLKFLSNQAQSRLGDLTALAQENLSGLGIIQSYVKEKEESARFYDTCRAHFDVNLKLIRTRVILMIVVGGLSGLSSLIILGEGGREVIFGELALSGFVAFMLYLERLSWPTISLGWIISSIQQGRVSVERINAVLALPVHENTQETKQTHLEAVASIELRNLSFRYDNPYQPEVSEEGLPWVLQDISVTINKGELVALVGPIGSGKTTLLHLLVRSYNAPLNTLFVNGDPIERYSVEAIRRQLTLMPQNTFLFSNTLTHNIAYGDPMAKENVVTDFTRVAQLHEEVQSFSEGYQTIVGERGVTLSGGQRQRSTLARTLLVEPSVLLLDDPFSNVDVGIEQAIIEALEERQLLRDRTTIFASQRFALVKRADKIMVLDQEGRLDSVGIHEDLLVTSELYRGLSQQQEPTDGVVMS